MNNIKKIILSLCIVYGYSELIFSAQDIEFNAEDFHESTEFVVPQKEMLKTLTQKQDPKNKDISTIEDRANQLIKDNYKTDTMKYDMLLFMNEDPFMVLDFTIASIKNLPTIDQIIQKTYEKNIDKKIKVKALESTLRAIHGALADDEYDNKSIFTSEIKTELIKMKNFIDMRLKQINPVSYLKYYVGATTLAALAATAGVYYYGITAKDAQDYVVGVGKDLANSASQNINVIVDSTTKAIQSATSSAISTINSSVNTLASSAAEQINTAINATHESIGSTISSTGSTIAPTIQ